MEIGFDPGKSEKNRRERGLPFELAADLEWDRAVTFEDTRFAYGETRIVALAPLKGRLHVVCYTQRDAVRWIISFRKANAREVKAYGQALDG
jgi:uncharacterized DUF497 family protein